MCKYSECPKRHKENELATASLTHSRIAVMLPGCIAAKEVTFKMVPSRAASLILKGVEKIPGELAAARLQGIVLGAKIVDNFSR